MTMAKTSGQRASGRFVIPDQFKDRLLHVPMVRLDYTVKDVPSKGQSLPKSVRVCDINHVRYLMVMDINIGGLHGLVRTYFHRESLERQMLHVYNPYLQGVVRLIPQRVFIERKDDLFDPMLITHPEWEKEFNRLVEVTGIADIPTSYQHVFEPYNVTDGEKANYELKLWRKEMRLKHGAATGNMMRKAKYRHGKEAVPE